MIVSLSDEKSLLVAPASVIVASSCTPLRIFAKGEDPHSRVRDRSGDSSGELDEILFTDLMLRTLLAPVKRL
jgi:hypothetical protein